LCHLIVGLRHQLRTQTRDFIFINMKTSQILRLISESKALRTQFSKDDFWVEEYDKLDRRFEEFKNIHIKILVDFLSFLGEISIFFDDQTIDLIFSKTPDNINDAIEFLYDNIKLIKDKIVETSENNEELRRMKKLLDKKIEKAEKDIAILIPLAKRGKIMTGRKLSTENEKTYRDILNIKKKLLIDKGGGHISSLTKAIIDYSIHNKKQWDKKKIKSIHSSISYHQKIGNLPK
jgi:hypothetical protein